MAPWPTLPSADRFRVAVIGAGVTGLAATHRLINQGVAPDEVVLVDASPQIGGKIFTEVVGGFLVEAGPDSFVIAKGPVMGLAGELGIGDRVIPARPEHAGSYIWWGDRLHRLPPGLLLMAPSRLGPLFRSSLLSWRGKLRMLGDLVLPARDSNGDESLESFVTRRLGREVLERIAEPLVAGIHSGEPATMSLQASFPRLMEMERSHRSLILAARRAGPPAAGHFASFRGGMGELAAAVSKGIDGVDVRLGTTIDRVEQGPEGFLVSGGVDLVAERVILAIPAGPAGRLLADTSPQAAEAVTETRQVSSVAVTLGYRSDQLPVLSGYGFVVPAAARRRVTGVSYLSNKWAGRAPPDCTLLRGFLTRPHPPEHMVVDTVRRELAEMLGINADPILTRIQVWDGGQHQYTLGHLDRVAAAEAAVPPGLHLAGSAFHGVGLNECVSSGRRAADAAIATAG